MWVRALNSSHAEWRDDALCAHSDHAPKFTTLNDRTDRVSLARAQAVCRRCPVIAECHMFAMQHKVTAGVWAGKHYGAHGGVLDG